MESKFLLPEDTIETLKCALCLNYLSIPPIMVISEDGERQICGRCHGIKSDVNIRNKSLENMLKFAQFPCIYQNCTEKLLWGKVEKHEEVCPYKAFRCNLFNLLEDCSDMVTVNDLRMHYILKRHVVGWMVNKFQKQMGFGKNGVYLFRKNGVPYLIYYDTSELKFWVCVFSLKKVSENAKYEMKLSTADSKFSMLYENHTVTPYKETEHCARCLFKECLIKSHRYSKLYGNGSAMIDSISTTNIDAAEVKRVLNSKTFICTITILDGTETLPLNKVNSFVKEQNVSNSFLRQALQCPICMEFMLAQIYTCRTGHVICHNCKMRVTACPTCKKEFGDARNYALEEITENVKLACQYQEQECLFVGKVADICEHEAQCYYKRSAINNFLKIIRSKK